MRPLVIAVVVLIAAALALVQAIATIAVRERAQPGSWVRLVPPAVAARVDRLNPALPLPVALRLLLARKALEDHDLKLAAAHVASLPPSRDRWALAGRLAEERGDDSAAARAYLEAGDLEGLEGRVAELELRGNLLAALGLQKATVARLQADRTQADALAEGEWRLGRLEQSEAYSLPPGSPERRVHETRSAQAYAAAVALAPFDQKYLIAAGSQALNLDELDRASTLFTRARQADPTSPDALAGLGEVALRRGDLASARAYLTRAQRVDPSAASVQRLAQKLGS